MASLSIVLNTCANGPRANILSSGRQPYADRRWLLRSIILPAYTVWFKDLFKEVIVVGEFEEGPGYTYVHCPSVHYNCGDALVQRQRGFEALTDTAIPWVVFSHDDHLLDPDTIVAPSEPADVLSPSRWTRSRCTAGEPLNDGSGLWPSAGNENPGFVPEVPQYVNGHVCLMRPSVFRNGFKWTDSPPVFTWDCRITERLQQLRTRIRYAPEIRTYDVEAGAEPWV